MAGARLDTWTALFLGTTILTSFTGFFFPFTGITPPYVVGAISLAVLALCLAARYWKRLALGWRTTYVITAVTALYLNIFVLVVQLFAKTPALAQLAPTQQEAPFALTQALVLALFVWLGWAALRGFRTERAGG
jgi:fucose 4-O-acetylase-like acetyltransferase